LVPSPYGSLAYPSAVVLMECTVSNITLSTTSPYGSLTIMVGCGGGGGGDDDELLLCLLYLPPPPNDCYFPSSSTTATS